MKLKGKKLSLPNIEIIVFPRPDEDIVFKAKGVQNVDDFEKICPKPRPPVSLLPGGAKRENIEDKGYLEKFDEWSEIKTAWIVLKSLSATEGIEWETVNMEKPETYKNWQQELKDSGLLDTEINHIFKAILSANSLDEDKLDDARKRFLLGPQDAPSK